MKAPQRSVSSEHNHQSATEAWPAGIIVLIPVYNHARQVGAVIRGCRERGAPVLVVDDGSTDGSGDAAEAAGAHHVYRQPRNQGKGRALQFGICRAQELGYDVVVTCDADGQHPVPDIHALALHAAADPSAIHIGQRNMGCAPMLSRCGRWWSNFWVMVVCGRWPGDSQSGLRAYPVSTCAVVPVTAARYAFEIEILVRASWDGVAIKAHEVAVLYPEDRVSHFNLLWDNLDASRVFARLLLRRLVPNARFVSAAGDESRKLASGMTPAAFALAAALGAGIGVSPLYGLHSMIAIAVGCLWRLNLPVILLFSNISFGPLLALWAAVAVVLGQWVTMGREPSAMISQMQQEFAATSGWSEWFALLSQHLQAWAIGSAVLIPAVAVTAGLLAFLYAGLCRLAMHSRAS